MTFSRPWMLFGLVQIGLGLAMLCQQGRHLAAENPANAALRGPKQKKSEKPRPKDPVAAEKSDGWIELFDGKTLDGWKTPRFGGEGRVYVKDGAIVMETGSMMTGVTWTGKPPKDNYELTLEGMRLEGSDFFCTATFPVGDESCSLVVGGWGGMVVGLSSVDGLDASENATTKVMSFKDKQWYRVRIRVTDAAIGAWIDDSQVVRQSRKDCKFTIRSEVELCRPLGICTWGTTGAVKNIRVRGVKAGK
ncbi:MAG: DUF1080 domain-containing protein [Planctomycetaceae bacterium]|nr:DUF1080 domain-containing protein [Planctomycetaceae bacterium]